MTKNTVFYSEFPVKEKRTLTQVLILLSFSPFMVALGTTHVNYISHVHMVYKAQVDTIKNSLPTFG